MRYKEVSHDIKVQDETSVDAEAAAGYPENLSYIINENGYTT